MIIIMLEVVWNIVKSCKILKFQMLLNVDYIIIILMPEEPFCQIRAHLFLIHCLLHFIFFIFFLLQSFLYAPLFNI